MDLYRARTKDPSGLCRISLLRQNIFPLLLDAEVLSKSNHREHGEKIKYYGFIINHIPQRPPPAIQKDFRPGQFSQHSVGQRNCPRSPTGETDRLFSLALILLQNSVNTVL